MGDQHQRGAGGAVEVEDQFGDFLAGFGVEIAGGFIGEEDFGAIDKRSRQGNPLLLAAGKLYRVVIHAVAQPHPLQQFFRPGLHPAFSAQLQGHHHIFQGGESRD